MLTELLADAPETVRYSVPFDAPLEDLLEQARSFGLEGLLGKQPDSCYESGRRSGAWIKLKLILSQEFVIGGYTPPAGGGQNFLAPIVGFYFPGDIFFSRKEGRRVFGKNPQKNYYHTLSFSPHGMSFVN